MNATNQNYHRRRYCNAAGVFSNEALAANSKPGKTVYVDVTLQEGESAWMPGTTAPDRAYRGPGDVLYTIHPEGGIDATFTPKKAKKKKKKVVDKSS